MVDALLVWSINACLDVNREPICSKFGLDIANHITREISIFLNFGCVQNPFNGENR